MENATNNVIDTHRSYNPNQIWNLTRTLGMKTWHGNGYNIWTLNESSRGRGANEDTRQSSRNMDTKSDTLNQSSNMHGNGNRYGRGVIHDDVSETAENIQL